MAGSKPQAFKSKRLTGVFWNFEDFVDYYNNAYCFRKSRENLAENWLNGFGCGLWANNDCQRFLVDRQTNLHSEQIQQDYAALKRK